MARRAAAVPDEWGPPERTAAPRRRSPLPVRGKRFILWAVLVTFPVSVITDVSLLSSRSHTAAASSATIPVSSPGMPMALVRLNTWLGTAPKPLPGGRVLGWTGARTTPPLMSANGQKISSWTSSVESFAVSDSAGNVYTASVQVALDPRGGGTVVAGPSLTALPGAANDGWVDALPWPGLDPIAVSDGVAQAVTQWASAYLSGSGDALRVVVGDTDTAHSYTPMSGATLSKAVTTNAGLLDPKNPSRVAARVVLDVTWPGQEGAAQLVFDVLLDRANTAAPVVLAWGGPGSGPTLTPFGNASAAAPRDNPSAPAFPDPKATH